MHFCPNESHPHEKPSPSRAAKCGSGTGIMTSGWLSWEHGFIGEHLHASSQQQRRVILPPRLAVKGRVVAGKAVNPHAFVKRRRAEDKIPRRLRIEVLHRDTQQAEGVLRQPSLQPMQHTPSQHLPLARHGVGGAGNAVRRGRVGGGGVGDTIRCRVVGPFIILAVQSGHDKIASSGRIRNNAQCL